MTNNLCPITAAFNEIRGGGLYVDDLEYSDETLIKLGGSQTPISYVMDEISFYLSSRKIELARFEITHPSLIECIKKSKIMFNHIIGRKYSEIYIYLIDNIFGRYMYSQFTALVDRIVKLEELIITKITEAAKCGRAINISMPNIVFMPHIDQLIIYRPDILEITINKIIDYINMININSLLKNPITINLQHINSFTEKAPNMNTKVGLINSSNASDYLIQMKKILEHEIIMATYLHKIEQYHTIVINYINQIFDFCDYIIVNL